MPPVAFQTVHGTIHRWLMKRILILTAVILLSVTSVTVPIDAAVFERDWKMPGDGLLTYDDVNRREWLDLSQSELSQFPSPFLEPALAELAPGGRFEGFQWATGDDVIALAESAGIDTTHRISVMNGLPTKRLVDLLVGEPLVTPDFPLELASFIQGAPASGERSLAVFRVWQNPFTLDYEGGVSVLPVLPNPIAAPTYQFVGLMLFRPVPEPSSHILLATAWVMLRARHRRRQCG